MAGRTHQENRVSHTSALMPESESPSDCSASDTASALYFGSRLMRLAARPAAGLALRDLASWRWCCSREDNTGLRKTCSMQSAKLHKGEEVGHGL